MGDATDTASERPGLVQRVRGLIVDPENEWIAIAREPASGLIGGHVRPLAILAALGMALAHVLQRGSALDTTAIWAGALSLAFVLLAPIGAVALAMIVNWLAPRFGAERNDDGARQVAVYALTPAFLGLALCFIPLAGALFVLAGAIYAIVHLALGLRIVMQPRDARATGFAATAVGLAVAIAVGLNAAAAPLLGSGRTILASATANLTSVAPPEDAAAPPAQRSPAERALAQLLQQHGVRVPVAPSRLEEQLPRTLPGGFALASASPSASDAISGVVAEYRSQDALLRVTVASFAQHAGVEALTELVRPPERRNDDTGYARTQSIGDRLYFEDVVQDEEASRTRYGVVGRSVIIMAEGDVMVDRARAAVETIAIQRLEGLFGG